MEKENQRVAMSKRLLEEGLMRLLDKKDIDKISVLELCREAGINRATFYRHYETPRDILVEMERKFFNEIYEMVAKPTSIQDIHRYMEDVCVFLEERREKLKVLVLSNTDTLFVQVLMDVYKEIAQSNKLKMFEELDEGSIELLSLYSSGGSYFILRQWLLGKIDKTPEEIAAVAYTLLDKTNWKEIVNYD